VNKTSIFSIVTKKLVSFSKTIYISKLILVPVVARPLPVQPVPIQPEQPVNPINPINPRKDSIDQADGLRDDKAPQR
jgi:hypothetical protein